MSEALPTPDPGRFPRLDPTYCRLLPEGTDLGRVFRTTGSHPTRWSDFRLFGPLATARFDTHPEPASEHPGHGVMYVAINHGDIPPLHACLSEAFQQTATVDCRTADPYFVQFATSRTLRLLDVSDTPWAADAGGNAALCSGSRARSREWARAIASSYPDEDLDGLWYASSTTPPARLLVLWERARTAIPPQPDVQLPLSHPAFRAELEAFAGRRRWRLVT